MTGIIVRSKIKEIVKKVDSENIVTNVSAEVGDELNRVTEEILRKAVERAKKNQRKTLLARDL